MKKHRVTEKVIREEESRDLIAEFDREANIRHFTGAPALLVRALLISFTVYVFWITLIASPGEQVRRASFLAYLIFITFMIYPVRRRQARRINHVPWYDLIFACVGAGSFLYYILNFETITDRAVRISPLDMLIALAGLLLLIEACRRVAGIPILIVAGGFVVYAFARGFTFRRVIHQLFYTTDGILGTPLGVCATFIVLFIFLGAFLEKTGIGSFFVDLANSVAGFASGGPAKVAVISSALQGIYSGSSVANTVGSGSVTIPVMKQAGYRPEFAAAVEAAASTGGQIMPPIMGAAAFLMAEMTDLPYSRIALAAILPAILYFTGIFLMIHFEAKKLGLRGLAREDIPHFGRLFLRRGYLFLPILVLVVLMSMGKTSAYAACYAILTAVIVSMFRKDTRLNLTTFSQALENGAKNTVGVAVACSVSGVIIGIVTMTGLGQDLIKVLLSVANNSLLLALFMTMIACIIIGMGVPTTANYVIMATITAPIVIKMGVPALAAHMFVFYFGIVADITPPVALAAYAGSAIAGSNPLKTGLTATRLAITAFIIPYMFALNPAMLLIDTTPLEIAQIAVTSLIGIFGVSAGMEGYMLRTMNMLERLSVTVGGLLLIEPKLVTDLTGVSLVALGVISQIVKRRKNPV
ncbi:TRAP transporter permease [Anaerolentibacter hominis]|uniref:TRAP transporter permease n=1 Tax=Anaerolentibacter hominis TaxID=3079009 RepID=UPI0031B834D3